MTEHSPKSNEQIRTEWSLGSYPDVGQSFLAIAARLVDAAGVGPGDVVLDVACGTGNVALTAHRRGAAVTGVDITPSMLATARDRAAVVDANVDWREGDAAALPFDDDTFDVTLSCLGHMFVPDATAAGAELVRVTRAGGRIGYASWTPDGAIASMMGALSAYLPPRPEAAPPFLWGDPGTVRDRLGGVVEELRFERAVATFPTLSPAHFWAAMTTHSGPIIVALDDVDDEARPALRDAVVAALGDYFSGADNAMELEYRVVTATVP